MTILTKVCSRCGHEKPTCEFPLEKRNSDGIGSQCRECRREICRISAAKRWRSNPELRERKKEYERQRRDSDVEREKSARYVRERRKTDEDFRLALAERQRTIPRETMLIYERNYRDRKRDNEEFEFYMARMEAEAEFDTQQPQENHNDTDYSTEVIQD